MTTEAETKTVEQETTGISKIFIGSLSFKTAKSSLTKAFTDLNVEVKTAKVVRNSNGRSMGYGFVEIPDKDVPLVIEKLHHTELDGRQINVEKATSTKPKRKPVKRTNNRTTKPATPKPEGEAAAPKDKAPKPAQAKKPAPTRKPARPVNTTPRESSETKLYVANIPFSLTDEELAAHFEGFGTVTGKVIVNKKTGRSRGYGFVELENNEQQKKALDDKNKSTVVGRIITVRAAYRELPVPEPSEEKAETKTETKVEEKTEAPAKAPAKKNKKSKKPRVKKENTDAKPVEGKPAVVAAESGVPVAETKEAPKAEKPEEDKKETPNA